MLPSLKWNSTFYLAVVLMTGPAMRLAAQTSTLPRTAPTTISPSQMPSANPPVGMITQQHAEILWDGNALQVITTNVGLNSLLQDIASKTNLQLSGSVPEERTFGTYGPGKLEDVLSDLLDGVAVNMLFVDRTGSGRKQLMLTSRAGGAATPSQGTQTSNKPYSAGTSGPTSQPPQSRPFQPVDPNAAARTQGNGSDAQAPASGVRTPQEIFEQLQRLRTISGR